MSFGLPQDPDGDNEHLIHIDEDNIYGPKDDYGAKRYRNQIGYIFLPNTRCCEPGCNNIAVYGDRVGCQYNRVCLQHKIEKHINVIPVLMNRYIVRKIESTVKGAAYGVSPGHDKRTAFVDIKVSSTAFYRFEKQLMNERCGFVFCNNRVMLIADTNKLNTLRDIFRKIVETFKTSIFVHIFDINDYMMRGFDIKLGYAIRSILDKQWDLVANKMLRKSLNTNPFQNCPDIMFENRIYYYPESETAKLNMHNREEIVIVKHLEE